MSKQGIICYETLLTLYRSERRISILLPLPSNFDELLEAYIESNTSLIAPNNISIFAQRQKKVILDKLQNVTTLIKAWRQLRNEKGKKTGLSLGGKQK